MPESTPTRPRTLDLLDAGQSVWLDSISRAMLDSGKLARMVADGWVTGVTSNPSIFEKAISGSPDYDLALRAAACDGVRDPYEAFVRLAVTDIRDACDVLLPVHTRSGGRDGFVSLEIPPGIEVSTPRTVAEALRLFGLVGRPNLMIKVPGTPEGVGAVAQLIAAGVNVNITLLFSLAQYEATAEAYLAGLERRLSLGQRLDTVASVASFFVSRLDTAVDAALPADSPLRGKAAVANARAAYRRFEAIFAGPRWAALEAAGARVQRPLWASTGTKNPAYSDVLYVDELVAPHTVNTMPEATLAAVLDHGNAAQAIAGGLPGSLRDLVALGEAGIDLDAVTARLLVEGLAAFDTDFRKLLARVGRALAAARVTAPYESAALGPLASAVGPGLAGLDRDRVVPRIWARDHTVWRDDPAEIADRLGWLTVAQTMRGAVAGLEAFAAEVAAEGFTTAVLLGMGGSSLAPEVFQATFGTRPGALRLVVLDSTHPDQIRAVEGALDLETTLFIAASKSGGTIETRSQLEYFWERAPRGRQFVAITDAGSSLDALAQERGFRTVFHAQADIGGRFSALSPFGLVPAALIGAPIAAILDQADAMAAACAGESAASANPGAWLGASIAACAKAGRDKLTLVLPPELATFGFWLEQLIAESTGKQGAGIVPIEGERLGAPAVYGGDRLFVALGEHAGLAALESAGHPVIRLAWSGDPAQIGAEIFRWEFATAVAGACLGLQPFDQPDVQAAKDATAKALAGELGAPEVPGAGHLLTRLRPGDYLAICAYLPRDAQTVAAFDRVRHRLRTRYGVATTVGFGPRFLHSTGQLHKGGPDSAVVLQVVGDPSDDLAIPGQRHTFGQLIAAQAAGDLASLAARRRRVARITVDELLAL